jgi:two-component system phosphate regulon sensor histidine kinase PhoR
LKRGGGCRAQLEEGQFALEQDIASDLPLVNVDSHAVARAVENLITNAIKYSGESRWIGLRAAKAPTEPDVFIEVSDRGIGIQPAELEHVFDPFFRGREVLEAQIHGSGLGLSLVKHIVESHSGTITVNSSVRNYVPK